MKRLIACALALALLLAGCGRVVPLRQEEPATAPEAAAEPAPAETPAEPVETPPEEEAAPEEAAAPPEEEAPAEEPTPEEAPAASEEEATEAAPEEAPEELPEEPAPAGEEPAPEEEPAELEEAEEAPEPLPPETAESPRALVTLQEESTVYTAADGETVLLRVTTALPRLRLLNAPLRLEAQINSSLQEDLEVLQRSMTGEDGRHRLLAMAEDEIYPGFAEEGQTSRFPTFLQRRTIEAARCDSRVLSLLYNDYFYTGGAHGGTMVHGGTYQLSDGKLLRFEDLSPDPEALRQRCAEHMAAAIQAEYAPGVIVPDYPELLPELAADPNWYLSEEGLVFVAPEYMLGALSLGMPHFTVPYALVEDLLSPALLPAEREDGRAWLYAEADDGQAASFVCACGEGEGSLRLAPEGTVYDLELERLDYRCTPEGTFLPASDGVLLCCGRLAEGETLLLRGLTPGLVPSLRLRWRGGDGEEQSCLLGLDGGGTILFIVE